MIQETLAGIQYTFNNLQEIKKSGKKIIGYIPNGYMPEEMVHACGAIPLALNKGGDPSPVAASAAYLARFLDPFCRAQIGYRRLKNEPLYQLPDMLVVPVTDNHVRAIADSWEFYSGIEVFRFGVPHVKAPHGLKYYMKGLESLKKRLEDLTGCEITEARLKEEIILSGKITGVLAEIASLRKWDHPPISGKEFIQLSHISLNADRYTLLKALQSLYDRLKNTDSSDHQMPRVLLAGSTLASGDLKVVDMLEEAGVSIVAEEFSEGLRQYRRKPAAGDSPLQNLADIYFSQRLPDAFFRGAAEERIDFMLGLVKEYRAEGVVWYTLMYRDSYDIEGYILHTKLDNLGIPMLRLSSDYDMTETGGFRTRIETFASTIQKE